MEEKAYTDRNLLELCEGGDKDDEENADIKKGDDKVDRATTIQRVTLADGTHIDKQIADFKDKDNSLENAKKIADFEANLENMKDEEKALYKLSTPIPLTNLMANRPCCMILSGFTLMLLISVFSFYMEWMTPNDPSDRDFMVWGDPYVTNMDKSLQASKELLQ